MTTVTVQDAIETPAAELNPIKEVQFFDGAPSRHTSAVLMFLTPEGELVQFRDESIPGTCVVLSRAYKKNGMWSGTTYQIKTRCQVVSFAVGGAGWAKALRCIETPAGVAYGLHLKFWTKARPDWTPTRDQVKALVSPEEWEHLLKVETEEAEL